MNNLMMTAGILILLAILSRMQTEMNIMLIQTM